MIFITSSGIEIVQKEGEDLNELKQWLFDMSKDKNPCAGGIEMENIKDSFVICNGDLGKYRNA